MNFTPVATFVAVALSAGSVLAADTQTSQKQATAQIQPQDQVEYPSVPPEYLRPQKTEEGKQKAEAAVEQLAQNVKKKDEKSFKQKQGDYYGAWRAMQTLYQEGRIRAIDVCNFKPDRLADLKYNFEVLPAVNQIELHPLYQREQELSFMRSLGIQPQAWAPFAEGFGGMFENPVLKVIARKHGKTVGQVILRWNIERGVAIIPKTVHKSRMVENLSIWDFALDEDDKKAIALLDLGKPQMLRVEDPSEVERVYDFLKNPRVR